MQKDYTIKVYNLSNVLQRVLSPKIVMSGISYSEQINGGQGQLSIKLKLPFTTTDIAYNNIIRVYQTDTSHAPRLIYTGLVGNISRNMDNSGEYIYVRCIGLASLLSMFYFNQTGYTFTKSQAGDITIENIVTYFSTKYPGLISYTDGSLDTASSVSLDFDYVKCLDAIKRVWEAFSTWWWGIGADGVVHFHPKSTIGTLHKVQVGYNVDKITVEENAEKIVNTYLLKYGGGSIYTKTDATSITDNGLRELYKDDSTKLTNLATATIAGDNYVAENKNYTRKISIEINSLYDIESIRAWDFITVQNFDYSILTLQVAKLEYNMDKIKVELEDYSSFTSELLN